MKNLLYRTGTLSMAMLLLSMLFSSSVYAQEQKLVEQLTKYNQTMYMIDRLYLDTVNVKQLVEKSIVSVLEELDPHSSFISAEEVEAMNEPLVGEFEGIGIEFAIIKDTLTVQATIAGGPSEKVGLLAGDKIIAVDSVDITDCNLKNSDVFKYLRGEKGSKVQLTVHRRSVKKPIDFTIVRDKIPINSLDAAYEVEPGCLYMKLSRFASPSHQEILTAMKNVKNGLKGVIIDLRGNAGGYLPTAINIANEFLESGDLIVYTEGRSMPRYNENADGSGFYKKGPLVIMVDENSASASEILSGAVQDQDRGVIVGRRTFGKGLVQQALPLSDGSELRLTVARYHTPSGRVIQSPYQSGKTVKYYSDFIERYTRGESFCRDSIHFPDSLKYATLKKGRTVYGGGGIMPDVFVPQDTTAYTDYYSSILRQGIIPEFINNLCDRNRSEWTGKYKDFASFDRKFKITDAVMNDLVAYAEEKGIEPAPEQLKRSMQDMKKYMKALVASSIISRDCFYRVMNEGDEEFLKAVETLKSMQL